MTMTPPLTFKSAPPMVLIDDISVPSPSVHAAHAAETNDIRWTWACRVNRLPRWETLSRERVGAPRVGDLVLVRVAELGSHERIITNDNVRLRIYPGDLVVGVFGNRYATDAFEGEVEDTVDLCLLTAGGMIGTVKSRHRSTAQPTSVRFVGYVGDGCGNVVNLKTATFRPGTPLESPSNLVAVVGTGMNAGKTTSCVKLIKALTDQQQRVAACKLTGSVSNRDQDEMRAASAIKVLDFSDFGFPSTYRCDKPELLSLFDTILAEMEPLRPDVTVMEIADGILQRETTMLLEDERFRRTVSGVVLAADNALSARYALDWLQERGHRVIAVTGLITSSPLCMRELEQIAEVPVAPSTGRGAALGTAVLSYLKRQAAGGAA